ncbi:MAG: hypothetical protein J6U26_01190 [Lachnospiraceae bacterium]|nr:hypothetical protein [Lachnospiraceae bacterium]
MEDLVLLNSPGVLLAALLGLMTILFEKNAARTGPFVSVLAVVAPLAALFLAVLSGASWTELSILVLADLAVLFAGNRKKEA